MKPIAAICSLCLLLAAGPTSAADCENWNTHEFFTTATPQAVTDCLQTGANVNVRDVGNKRTPLHRAASSNNNPAVFRVLLDAGADPKARDMYGLTPLHSAVMHNNAAIGNALINAGVDSKARDQTARNNLAIITALLNAGANPNARNKQGATPLHRAAKINTNPAIITTLLDAGADAKAKDKSGRTPFDYAREKNERLKNTDVYWRLNEAQY